MSADTLLRVATYEYVSSGNQKGNEKKAGLDATNFLIPFCALDSRHSNCCYPFGILSARGSSYSANIGILGSSASSVETKLSHSP
jgi:hypothetical protein